MTPQSRSDKPKPPVWLFLLAIPLATLVRAVIMPDDLSAIAEAAWIAGTILVMIAVVYGGFYALSRR